MYLRIKKATIVPDKYGQKIAISMVGLYNEDDKRVKRVKLDDDVVQSLLSSKLEINVTNRNTSKEAGHATQPNLL